MTRWLWFWLCAIFGMAMLVCGLLVPMHLRAVDAGVITEAGGKDHGVVADGLEAARTGNLGTAQLLLQTAHLQRFPDTVALESAVDGMAKQYPDSVYWGGAKPAFAPLFQGWEPFTELIIQKDNRGKALDHLAASKDPIARELLSCRELTNTVIFPPSSSAAGQAFDAAIAVAGLLIEDNQLAKGLRDALVAQAAGANSGGNPQRLEQMLEDLMSLGQRFNWNQLTAFVAKIDSAETLRLLADDARNAGDRLPVLFSAVALSGNPAGVAGYMLNFGQSGAADLGAATRHGGGAINELVRRNQRLDSPGVATRFPMGAVLGGFIALATEWSLRTPAFALCLKWFFYLLAGFLLAGATHFAAPPVPELERPLEVRGVHAVRQILFALGFLLVVLLVSEPFLAQDTQKAAIPFHPRLPVVAGAVTGGNTSVKPSIMNQVNLLTLLLFFVLQALIYLACLLKLAEIRRQHVSARVRLKLLENEEHLFDAGLYLGFVGTIISLILVSMGIISFTLMAAYSSTSFGIIFVSIFKIFHLRPARRNLLMESETIDTDPLTSESALRS